MQPRTDPDDTPADGDAEFAGFVAEFQHALAAGGPPPSPDRLPKHLRPRWDRVRPVLVALDRAKGSGTWTPVSAPTPVAAPPVERIGRFIVERLIGRGGMGVVYEAHDPTLGRSVAVKVLDAGDPTRAARFAAEAGLLARLGHPNVVRVYEAGEHAGRPFLAMELVAGPTLHAWLSGAPADPRAAAELLEPLARAVAHAHSHGVVHRDLKPANVLLEEGGRRKAEGGIDFSTFRLPPSAFRPKVSDFGLATATDDGPRLTRTGEAVGTPAYMAPEQVTGGPAASAPAVDVYGLGAVLYECLTGRPPFAGTRPAVVLVRVQFADPVPPRRLHPEVPRDLETICLKCLEKDPARRYPSADTLADDLRRFLDGKTVAARPAGVVRRVGKWVRRRPAVAVLLAMLAAAVVGGTGALFAFNRRLQQEVNRATYEEGEAKTARKAAEDHLLDLNRQLGFAADAAGEWPRAALLFADVARRAADPGPDRARWAAYTAASPVPWRAVRLAGGKRPFGIHLHPGGGWLIAFYANAPNELWDLRAERRADWPGRGPVCAANFSPDGTVLAVGTTDAAVTLYDWPAGRPRAAWKADAPIVCLAFDRAGKFVAAGRTTVEVRAVADGTPVGPPLVHPKLVYGAAFSPDAALLATGCIDLQARVFRPAAGAEPVLGPVPHATRFSGFPREDIPAFTKDDEVVTWSAEGIVTRRVSTKAVTSKSPSRAHGQVAARTPPAGGMLLELFHMGEADLTAGGLSAAWGGPRHALAAAEAGEFSADGTRILLGRQSAVQLWDVESTPVGSPQPVQGNSWPLTVSAGGRWLAACSGPGVVKVWRGEPRGLVAASLQLPRVPGLPGILAVDPNRGRLFALSEPGVIRVHALDGTPVGPPLDLEGTPAAAAFSPDGDTLYVVVNPLAALRQGALLAFRWATGEKAFPPARFAHLPLGLAVRPDGGAVVVTGISGQIEFRSTADGSLLAAGSHAGNLGLTAYPPGRVQFASDGHIAISYGFGPRVQTWGPSGEPGQPLIPTEWADTGVATFDPVGRHAVLVEREAISDETRAGRVRVWAVEPPAPAGPLLLHPDRAFAARFDPAGDRVATACRDGRVRVWDWRTGAQTVPEMVLPNEATDAAFSPDGRRVAAAGGGVARVWEAATGRPLTPPLRLAPPWVAPYYAHRVDFTADGRHLVVTVRTVRARVFDLSPLDAPPPAGLGADGLVGLAELNAGGVLRANGQVEQLVGDEWMSRWEAFRRDHPEVHAWPDP